MHSLNDSITFGKYKGLKIIDIINNDPFYIEWLVKKDTDLFQLNIEGKKYLIDKLSEKTFFNMCKRINKTKIKIKR